MRQVALGMRAVLWAFFVANLYVTMVMLSGGSAAVMSMVACVMLFAYLTYNHMQFDRKGDLRERTVREDHPVVVVPDHVGGRLPHAPDLEHFDWKSHRDAGISGSVSGNAVRNAQALGDAGTAKEPGEAEPGYKAVD